MCFLLDVPALPPRCPGFAMSRKLPPQCPDFSSSTSRLCLPDVPTLSSGCMYRVCLFDVPHLASGCQGIFFSLSLPCLLDVPTFPPRCPGFSSSMSRLLLLDVPTLSPQCPGLASSMSRGSRVTQQGSAGCATACGSVGPSSTSLGESIIGSTSLFTTEG